MKTRGGKRKLDKVDAGESTLGSSPGIIIKVARNNPPSDVEQNVLTIKDEIGKPMEGQNADYIPPFITALISESIEEGASAVKIQLDQEAVTKTPFFRTDPLLYQKYGNFSVRNLIFIL